MYGDKIAQLRNNWNLSQRRMAREVGIERAALSHYERNRREPNFQTIIRIADYFRVSVDDIIRHE
ncbi:helix-turn-helix transcriptional regulator [Paenibacillus chitinolyticus]|uniref:helix-turn-helix transcriptional regulator n=1 Tax=Paenibacillus chitinolyticus TaxID=79263 RepID=UPI0036558DAE